MPKKSRYPYFICGLIISWRNDTFRLELGFIPLIFQKAAKKFNYFKISTWFLNFSFFMMGLSAWSFLNLATTVKTGVWNEALRKPLAMLETGLTSNNQISKSIPQLSPDLLIKKFFNVEGQWDSEFYSQAAKIRHLLCTERLKKKRLHA